MRVTACRMSAHHVVAMQRTLPCIVLLYLPHASMTRHTFSYTFPLIATLLHTLLLCTIAFSRRREGCAIQPFTRWPTPSRGE